MRRVLARRLALCLLGLAILFGSTPHQSPTTPPALMAQNEPGNGSGGGG